jgi:hypothetical protein
MRSEHARTPARDAHRLVIHQKNSDSSPMHGALEHP